MSLRAMTWALDQDLPPNEKLVLLAIVDHISPEGLCWPSQERIAKRASMSVRTVRRVIEKLEEKGILIRERYRANPSGNRTTDLYRVEHNWASRTECPPDAAGQTDGVNRPTVSGSENPQGTPKRTKERARKPETPLPDDWTPTDEHRILAANKGLDIDQESTLFRDHAETYDRRAVVWNSAFNTWLRKAKPAIRSVGPRQQPTVPDAPRYPELPPDDGFEPFFPSPEEYAAEQAARRAAKGLPPLPPSSYGVKG